MDSKRKNFKNVLDNAVNESFLRWFCEMRNQNAFISGPMISEKKRKRKSKTRKFSSLPVSKPVIDSYLFFLYTTELFSNLLWEKKRRLQLQHYLKTAKKRKQIFLQIVCIMLMKLVFYHLIFYQRNKTMNFKLYCCKGDRK